MVRVIPLLGQLDDLRTSLIEGLAYRSPTVSFKVDGEVYEVPDHKAKPVVAHLSAALGELYELAAA